MAADNNSKPVIDKDTCTGCTICVEECPTGALEMPEDVAVLANPDLCDSCGVCEEVCPVSCIIME
ncbi:MAG: ATP-binding protein [Elusimicrobiota bacterium]